MDTTEKDLREPWRICKFIAQHPNIAFGITLSVHLFFVMVSVGLMIGGYSLFPVEFKALPLDLYSQPWVKRELAFSSRYSFPGQVHRQFPKQLVDDKWERSTMFSKSLAVLYDGEGSNVLTPDGLRAMQKIEDSLFNVPTYTHFCQLTQDRKCYPAMSILRFFDGTLTFLDPVFYDPEFKNIPAVIYAAYTNEITKDKFVLSLGKGSVIKPDQVHVSLIRSIIPFGAESGWLNTDEREAMIQFINDDFQPLLDHYVEKETAFSFMYYEEFLMLSDAVKQGFKDMRLAGGSVVFIFLFILFHTRSLFVTSLSVFSIVCSFVETNLVYRVVLDFRYFGYFHVLVMFIILGIGADDLFVFWDAWKTAGLRKFPTLAHRLDATYRKSVVSMFVTSLTTMLAFLSSAQSPMLATMSFGIFSAMLVTLDYISVITFFPTIIVFYHVHFEKKPALCCLCCPGGKRKASGGSAKASTCCCLVGGGGGEGGIRCEQVLTATTTTRDSHPVDTAAGAGGGGACLSHSGDVASAAPGGPKTENCPQDGGRADVHADISQTGTVFRSSSNASRRSRSQNPQGATTTTADSTAVAGAPEPQATYLDDTTEPTFLNLDSPGSSLPMKSPANRRLNNRQSRAGAQSTTSTANQYSDFGAEPTFSRNTSNNGNRSTTVSSSTPSGARSLNQYQDFSPSSPSSSSFADRNNSTSQLLPDLGPALVADLNATAADDEDNTELAQPELRWLVRFFRDYYFRFVTHRVFRWVVLVGLLALIVVFSISAARLEPDDKQIGLFRENHPYTRAFRRMSSGFVANGEDYSLLLWMVWGLKEQDMSECHFSDYNCQGEQRFDQSFDASTRAAQIGLVKLCDALYNFTDKDVKDYAIKRDFKTKDPLIFCFTKSLNAFLKADQTLSDLHIADGLPWNRSHISKFAEPVLEKMSNVSASSGMLNSSFTDFLDVPLNYWAWGGYHGVEAFLKNWNDTYVFGEQETDFTRIIYFLSSPVMVGNKIKWIGVQVWLDLKYETLAYTHHMPIFDRWEKFMADQLKEMPEEMKGGFQTTAVAWHLLHIQQALVFNAVTGIILGIALCLPILIVSTCNVINGLLATLTICGVTACVIGVVPMCGWKLGVLVSLNMCLVVGLAVDYVVHLAEGYHMSKARDRHGRLKHALETMGISVFSGACTTLGASTFMLFSKIQFFYQFGIFMFCTIGFSLLFSLGLYVTVMGIVGPEGDVGDIRVPFRACVRRLTCRRKGVRIPSSSSSSEGGLIGLSDCKPSKCSQARGATKIQTKGSVYKPSKPGRQQ